MKGLFLFPREQWLEAIKTEVTSESATSYNGVADVVPGDADKDESMIKEEYR